MKDEGNLTVQNPSGRQPFGSIRFWGIFLCFCVRYKVFSVYCTLSQTEKSSVNKEDFDIKFDLIRKKTFFNSVLVYTFLNLFFAVPVTFLLKYAKSALFSLDHLHQTLLTPFP